MVRMSNMIQINLGGIRQDSLAKVLEGHWKVNFHWKIFCQWKKPPPEVPLNDPT